jgi:30S ribosomal protein S31
MGKGDKRTRRGKIFKGSYGKSRPHKTKRAKPN